MNQEGELNPTGEELRHSRPLDVHKWSDHSEVNTFVDKIHLDHFSDYGGNRSIAKKHTKLVLLDLYVAWKDDPSLKIYYSRNNNDYKRGRYNELKISRKTPLIVDKLENEGLVGTVLGFHDRGEGGSSFQSRMWPTDKLISMFEEARFGPLDICDHPDRECIILRDEDKNNIEYEDNDTTNKMRRVLKDYNALIADTFIDIPALEKARIHVGPDHRDEQQYVYVNQTDKFTCRIFNRSSFEKGGRFYGGWWQRIPKEYRAKIYIDDQPTSEIDYSGLHIVLLYAKEGINYWEDIGGDPYEVQKPDWLSEDVDYRQMCKSLLLVAVNAETRFGAIRAYQTSTAPGSPENELDHQQLGKILDHIQDKHHQIAHYLASDMGIHLMYTDSMISEWVVDHFTLKGVPILVIHDSYIVPDGQESELEWAMQRAFAEVTGVKNPRVKEETFHPETYEPLSWDDAVGFDYDLSQQDVEYRHNPPRSPRYQSMWNRFKDLKGKPDQPDWTTEFSRGD